MYHGLLLINKPTGVTSHDVVALVRKEIRQKGVGHTGTLDPLAEGLLAICLGRATKVARYITGMKKTYEAEVSLGLRSTTFDAEGIDLSAKREAVPELSEDDIATLLEKFRGRIKQQVPAYSAVQVDGERLYKVARKGGKVELPVRDIEVYDIDLIEYTEPTMKIRLTCSSGTYVRAIANDIGEKLGCGAYLSGLRRTQVGPFRLEDSLTSDELQVYHEDGSLETRLLPIEHVLPFSAIKVTDEFSELVIQGRTLTGNDIAAIEGSFEAGEHVLLKDAKGVALAVGKAAAGSRDMAEGRAETFFSYERVLN